MYMNVFVDRVGRAYFGAPVFTRAETAGRIQTDTLRLRTYATSEDLTFIGVMNTVDTPKEEQ